MLENLSYLVRSSGDNVASAALEMALGGWVNVNSQDAVYGSTPLHHAMYHNFPSLVRLLLAQGASPLARNWNGLTALGLTRDQEIVQLLLGGGAEVNSRDNQGNTVILNCVDTDLQAGPHCSLQLLV